MKKLFIALLLNLPIAFTSCDILYDVVTYSLEQSAGKPNLNYDWENVSGGVRVTGTLRNDGSNTVTKTSVKVYLTANNGDTDYDWIEVGEDISSGSCVRFCETVYTNLDDVTDVFCKVSTYN